jgi:hypothetical protein
MRPRLDVCVRRRALAGVASERGVPMRIKSCVHVAGLLAVLASVSASANEPLFAPTVATTEMAAASTFLSAPVGSFTEHDRVDAKPPSAGQVQQLQSAASQLFQQMYSSSKPQVICGMTLLPADPKLDAKIRTGIPAGGVKAMMRTVAPQVCRGTTTSRPTAPSTRK